NNSISTAFVFENVPHGVPGMAEGGAVWGDMDNDGDLDLAVSGGAGDQIRHYCRIYRNENGALNSVAAELPASVHGSVAWGDYDNDGDLDLLVSGLLTNGFFTRIFRNNNSVFTDTGILLPAVGYADAQWCDYDRDGDLDIAIMGFHQQANVPLTRIYRND